MQEKEIWKPIDDYPRYEISNLGKIRSWATYDPTQTTLRKKPKLLKPTPRQCNKYLTIQLYNKNGYKRFDVHRLVLTAFRGSCPAEMESCHNDGNRQNNHIDNLRWDTLINNTQDRIKHGTYQFGELNPHARLTEQDVLKIRKRAKQGESNISIAKDFPVNRNTINRIINRKRWKHI